MKISARCISPCLILLLLAGAVPVPAQVIPGKWQKVDLLPAGSEIIIKNESGEVLECYYFSSTREILLVVESVSKEQRRIPKSSVKLITAKDYDDRLLNGALLGLSVGVAAGIGVTTVSESARQRNSTTDRAFGAFLFGMLGMGLGILIDYHRRGQEVVYEAPGKTDR